MTPSLVQTLLRTTPSLAPVTNRALLSVTGSHAPEFLHGLLATSVQKPPRNQFSSVLHPQGRVMYDLFIYATTDGFLLEYDSRESEATPLLTYFKRHVLRSKVKLRSVTDEYDIWCAWGSSKDRDWESKRDWRWAQSGAVEPVWQDVESGGSPWDSEPLVINDRRAVGMGRRLLVPKGTLPPQKSTHDVLPTEEYTLHRILHGVPEGFNDIPPLQAFPMDSNLDMMGAVDFRKGCYVGQELTVRTYHTGVVRKRIFPVLLKGNNDSAPSSLPPLPDNLDIKTVHTNIESKGPRPRGAGKLLSTHNNVGLALLRLEHVAGINKGGLRLQVELPDDAQVQLLEVSPWRPDWWPQPPPGDD